MKFSALIVSSAVAQVASAHYFMDTNIQNGVAQPAFKYVRQSTRATKYNPIKFSSNPPADIRDHSHVDSDDIICNQGAFSSAGRTQVLTVNAGDQIRLQLAVGAKFQHPGPELVYMAKAPGKVQQFSGKEGNWFKIHEQGLCNGGDITSTAWCDYGKNYISATIPKDTPSGEYLARFEHIGVHRSHVNQPEHYVSCLQVKVQNGGNGTPGPTVKFPGAYKATDPYANFSIYGGRKAFPMPGPAVWKGGAGGGKVAAAAVAAPVMKAPSTLSTKPIPAPTPAPAPGAGGQAGCAAKWGQCGGQGFSGAKCCSSGTCKVMNPYYSQCQ